MKAVSLIFLQAVNPALASWLGEVTPQLEELAGVSTSDAQGILEAQSAEVFTDFKAGVPATEAAALVLKRPDVKADAPFMAKRPAPTGKRFESFMVEQLAIVLREQRGLPTDESFYRRLVCVFERHIERNPFYKKTPRVFRGLTAFYVIAALAVKQVFPGSWVDNSSMSRSTSEKLLARFA